MPGVLIQHCQDDKCLMIMHMVREAKLNDHTTSASKWPCSTGSIELRQLLKTGHTRVRSLGPMASLHVGACIVGFVSCRPDLSGLYRTCLTTALLSASLFCPVCRALRAMPTPSVEASHAHACCITVRTHPEAACQRQNAYGACKFIAFRLHPL